MSHITRRRFLEDSILATAAAAAASSSLPAAADDTSTPSANSKITAAIIGCGIRGKQHARELARFADCDIAYVCDPDTARTAEVAALLAEQKRPAPKAVQDMRAILDDKSVDAVFIATCNHWHALAAIWAMQAGKDAYVEKPVSHNVDEGRRIVQVARKTQRICQGGTQNRSNAALAAAVEYMRQGKLGEVKLARSIVYGRRGSIGGPGTCDIPASVDYNLWAGPAPKGPLSRSQFHYDWHWVWDTGNGELGNNNIHSLDICRWGLGLAGLGRRVLSYGGRFGYIDAGQTPNTQVCVFDFGDKTIVSETRGLKTDPFHPNYKGGWIFFGTEGIISGTSLFDLKGNLVRTFEGKTESHFANFLKAVRSRKREDLNAEIIEGHQSTALCHVGNISWRLGRPASTADVRGQLTGLKVHDDVLETFERTARHLGENGVDLAQTKLTLGPVLELDSERESFVKHPAADALLTRDYRKPFVVPAASEV
ncbi:MAG: Gfo/Idh/MocA family oxidoreductase [Planctomycetaceae bacterium]|nr:Gfo/Idh/MocA family oxidoreductase [Planctomycetaceae bacterium]